MTGSTEGGSEEHSGCSNDHTTPTPAPTAARELLFIVRYFNRARSMAAAPVTTPALPGRSPSAPRLPLGDTGGGRGAAPLAAARMRRALGPRRGAGVRRRAGGQPLEALSAVEAVPSACWGERLRFPSQLEMWETRVVPAPRLSATCGPFGSQLKMAAGLRGGSA